MAMIEEGILTGNYETQRGVVLLVELESLQPVDGSSI